MQLSVSSGKFGILQRATFLTFGDSTDHTSDYPLADMVASANEWVAKVATKIWRATDTWEFDDKNQTDLPIATTTLVNNQQDYSLPTTILKLLRVQVKDSAGNWRRVLPIDQSEVDIALDEFEETAGIPIYYDILANSLFLYPKPDTSKVTASGGLKIWMEREATTFSVPASYTTADTTEPGFDEDFHDIICYGIAHDYLRANEQKQKADDYFAIITAMFEDLLNRYGNKSKDKKVKLRPKMNRYN